MPVRTGYEQLLAQRSTSTFASSAKGKGTVTYLDNAALIVTYENGKEHRIELGRKYGRDGDLIIPHEILPFVKLGQEVNEGDILSYNSGFFTPDPLNKNNVAYKAGKMLNVVLLESELTIEDSSALTVKAAKAMGVSTTKMRSIVVNFDQEIHRLIKPGTAVDVNDILCIMEDSLTTDSGAFDDAGLEALSRLARQTPKAKYKGIVEKIEVFYNGDIEDMSDSLAELTNKSNAVMYRNSKLVNGKGFTGSVDETYRVDGNPLIVDTAVINIYITKDFSMSVGDKGVFANQLKTTFGEILPYVPVTETGTEIDAVFGGKSVFARIVNSPMALGTANVLLANASKMMAKMYLED